MHFLNFLFFISSSGSADISNAYSVELLQTINKIAQANSLI